MNEVNLPGGGGAKPPVRSITLFPNLTPEKLVDGEATYLRSGIIETDVTKFSADIWGNTKGTYWPRVYGSAISGHVLVDADANNAGIIVAIFHTGSGNDGRVALSIDGGLSWDDNVILGGAGTTQLNCVKWVQSLGLFIVGGGSGSIYTSADGRNWTKRASGTTNPLWHIEFNGTMLVLVGTAIILTSLNGTAWTNRAIPAGMSAFTFNSVAFANGKWLATAHSSGGSSATSVDGITWVQGATPWTTESFVLAVDNKFYIGGAGKMWSSVDGANFVLIADVYGPNPNTQIKRFTYFNGDFYWSIGTNQIVRTKDFKFLQQVGCGLGGGSVRLVKYMTNGMLIATIDSINIYLGNLFLYAGNPEAIRMNSTSYPNQDSYAWVRIS